MGFGGISIWQLLIVAVIIILLFGTKKLRNIGGDLGNAVKGFKKAMNEDESKPADEAKKLSQEDASFDQPASKTSDEKAPEKASEKK